MDECIDGQLAGGGEVEREAIALLRTNCKGNAPPHDIWYKLNFF